MATYRHIVYRVEHEATGMGPFTHGEARTLVGVRWACPDEPALDRYFPLAMRERLAAAGFVLARYSVAPRNLRMLSPRECTFAAGRRISSWRLAACS